MGIQMRNASLRALRGKPGGLDDLLLAVGRHRELGPLRLPPADFNELGTGVVPALTYRRADLADDPLLAWIGVSIRQERDLARIELEREPRRSDGPGTHAVNVQPSRARHTIDLSWHL
jgi:hypothetical protein